MPHDPSAPRHRHAGVFVVAGIPRLILICILLASIRRPQSISYDRGHWYVYVRSISPRSGIRARVPEASSLPVSHTTHATACATRPSLGTESIKIGYNRDRSTRGEVPRLEPLYSLRGWGRLPSRPSDVMDTVAPHRSGARDNCKGKSIDTVAFSVQSTNQNEGFPAW